MTPQEAREAAAVMLAWAEGKKIEYRLKGAFLWRGVLDPVWDFECNEYRVAPEPWTGKVWVKGDETAIYRESHDADEWRNEGFCLVSVKEVGDE